ncbi:hypothetical protein [Microbacterium sp. 77mftsu3.1]|uniref:hypothetical protein n=1 Tax=Microbacterium sp. 77mftsu3.1 TaxID=1761802 RepID=UPI00036BA8DF|nr:hypothetical protein [Microbacterium sp. 77mftsu3.1]SDH48200.1 hypothetical protein SAMN04488590_3404 [Microbacterium sp. 77mftsu3.1]
MSKRRPAALNQANVLNREASKAAKLIDAQLREKVGPNPTEEDVLAVFPEFFPGSHANERQIRQYARSVIAGRPHFV